MRSWIGILVLLFSCMLPSLTRAQNPDPRDYEVGYFVPTRTTIINTYLRQQQSVVGRDFSAQALALRATYILKIGDVVVTPFDAILPVQNTTGFTPLAAFAAAEPAFASVPSDLKLSTHATGIGDLVYLPTIGHGLTQDKDTNTHTWYALTCYITAPTGQYDPARLLNVGANRWTINPLVMVGQRFARAFTLEAMANLAFYTSNDEFRVPSAALAGVDLSLKQKPTFAAALQAAVDLHPMFFVGATYWLTVNGERSYLLPTGVENVETIGHTIHSVRINFGIRVTPQTLILAQWHEDVARSAGGRTSGGVLGRFFGLRLSHAFFSPVKVPGREPITDPAAKRTAADPG